MAIKFYMDMYWMEKIWGKKKCHCQRVSAVTFCFVFLYVWKMSFSIYGAVWDFPIISFQYEKRTATNFRSVTRTWTVSLCVCSVESGLCLSSYLCMYRCWFITWKFYNIEVDLSILIGRLIIPSTNQSSTSFGFKPQNRSKLACCVPLCNI